MTRANVAGIAVALAACSHGNDAPLSEQLEQLGIAPSALFAEPTAAELEANRESRDRDRAPASVKVLDVRTLENGDTLRIVSHLVDGVTHIGAIFVPPKTSRPMPVLVYSVGFGPPFELPLDGVFAGFNGAAITAFPAFRGHTVRLGEDAWVADGDRYDQCDGGAEDALHLLEVVLALEPLADPDRIIFAGGSRGGNVSMIAALRDPRIDRVTSIAGPTAYLVKDFADHPNLTLLYKEWFLRELLDSNGTIEEARQRMLACSPLYFINELPRTQLHHGTEDQQVPVRSATAFAEARDAQGLAEEDLQVFIYEGEGHSLSSALQQANERIFNFVAELFE